MWVSKNIQLRNIGKRSHDLSNNTMAIEIQYNSSVKGKKNPDVYMNSAFTSDTREWDLKFVMDSFMKISGQCPTAVKKLI